MQNTLKTLLILIFWLVPDISICQGSGTSGISMEALSHTWHWRCASGDASLNFHPATIVDSVHTLVFDSLPYAKSYTMMVVYKPVAETESVVWKMDFDTASLRGLTTEHILSDNVTIRYSDATSESPVINTLRQTAPDSVSPFVRLSLGGDTLSGSIKVAEVLYYDRRLDNSMLRRVQSALAIRYGITLGPVDYVDEEGNTIWDYADSGLYHHRVTGIGHDSTYNLHQFRSRSEMSGAILTVGTDGIPEGDFFVCGDNDAPLSFDIDGDIEVMNRRWRLNCTDVENNEFHLTFDTRGFVGENDSLLLLVDELVYRPDSVTANDVTYKYVMFPTDTSTFTLAKGSVFWQTEMCNGNGTQHGKESVKSYVYPNPTTGNYTIEVTGADWVRIHIYNAQGVLMDSFGDREQAQYLFTGSLPSGNSYYATVTTENGTQTIKLIVK